jgi:hypothetical protein
MYDILSVGQNNMDATYTGVVNQGNIAKIGTGTQVFNGNSYGATNGLNGNAWSVTMGNMTIGNADTTSYPSQGNMTVTYPGNLIWNRADITSSGNGVMLLQNLGGNGNITFNGVTGQSYGTGYYHSPIVQSTANYQAVNDYRYPNNTNYTGNIYLQSNSKYSVYDANTRPTKVTVEANSQIYLQAPWVYQFYTSNSSLTLPGNSYTIQGTIVGGGGGGGGGANISSSFRSGHGGSGGGVVTFSETNRAGGTFAIVVGAAGAGGPGVTGGAASGSYGSDGGASSAFGYTAGAGTGGLNNSVGVQTAPAGGGTGGAGRTTDPQNGTLSSVTSSLFNNSVQYSPGGMGGALTGTIPTPLTGASTGSIGIGSIAAIRGTYYGAGGGGGSAANNNTPTAGSAGVGGMVALRYFQNGTPALTTDFVLNGNGVNENGTYNGALRSNTAAWTLSGNITVATDARIRADNQPLYLTGNLTGAGNLDLAGNAAINFTSANNTLTGTITIATALYLGNITNTCGYSVSTGALISASANGAPTAYTTTGTLTMALNSRMRVYSDGVNVLSRMDVGSMTVNGAWFIDMLSLTTTSGTYTLIGFTTPAPATVPSLGINGTGKTVVFSYVDGTGLVVSLS